MSTILTDDEIGTIQRSSLVFSQYSSKAFARAVEAAVLAKLAQQEPVAQWQKRHPLRTENQWENTHEHDAKWWRDNSQGWEIRALYTRPAPQQADRCPECGYLKTQREHLGCLRKAVADLDSATGGPFGAQQAEQEVSPAVSDAYDMLDRFLRNNLDDADYADFSHALDLISTPPAPQQADRQRVPDEDSPAVCDAYERIDRFLRNNLGDEDYADYSHDLDLLAAAPEAPAQEKSNG